jgi:predicted nucleic acid-binding protein
VDASVAVKWILPEPGSERALLLQERYADEDVDLVAPVLLVSEVGNVLWKRHRRGELTASEAQRCFEQFLRTSPALLDSNRTSTAALGIALAHDRPIYDCLYLAWALELRCDLVTADEKFFRALGAVFSCIQLLQHA